MTHILFLDHIVFVLLFGVIVGVEHWWSARRAQAWRQRWLDELQQIKRNWGIIAPVLEDARGKIERHGREIADLKRRVNDLEAHDG